MEHKMQNMSIRSGYFALSIFSTRHLCLWYTQFQTNSIDNATKQIESRTKWLQKKMQKQKQKNCISCGMATNKKTVDGNLILHAMYWLFPHMYMYGYYIYFLSIVQDVFRLFKFPFSCASVFYRKRYDFFLISHTLYTMHHLRMCGDFIAIELLMAMGKRKTRTKPDKRHVDEGCGGLSGMLNGLYSSIFSHVFIQWRKE